MTTSNCSGARYTGDGSTVVVVVSVVVVSVVVVSVVVVSVVVVSVVGSLVVAVSVEVGSSVGVELECQATSSTLGQVEASREVDVPDHEAGQGAPVEVGDADSEGESPGQGERKREATHVTSPP